MANYVSSYTGNQHDMYVTKSQLINLIYPVGAIYISTNSTSPATLFGGTWVQIQDKFLLACGETYINGEEGGEAMHLLTDEEVPTHTHTRGTMEITGEQQLPNVYGDNDWPKYSSGALYWTKRGGWFDNGDNATCNNVVINFQASRNWTGETSPAGGGGSHNNMPPYLAVFVWQRTA